MVVASIKTNIVQDDKYNYCDSQQVDLVAGIGH